MRTVPASLVAITVMGISTLAHAGPSEDVEDEDGDLDVAQHAAPHSRLFELGPTFRLHSDVHAGDVTTMGESVGFDGTVLFELGHGFRVGGALGVTRWRNDLTAIRDSSNIVVMGAAVVRYEIFTGAFRPYVKGELGLGKSMMSTDFTLVDLRTTEGTDQRTTVNRTDGRAWMYQLAVGFRRALQSRFAVVGEVGLRQTYLSTDVSTTDLMKNVSQVDTIRLSDVNVRVAVEVGF